MLVQIADGSAGGRLRYTLKGRFGVCDAPAMQDACMPIKSATEGGPVGEFGHEVFR